MTETDTYLFSRMRDELVSQNKKLTQVVEQLEAQTKLQEGIFKQLYLLCQMTSRSSTDGKFEIASESEEVFMNTPMSKLEYDDKNDYETYESILLKRYTDETGEVVYFSESNDKFIKWILRNIKSHVKEESKQEN